MCTSPHNDCSSGDAMRGRSSAECARGVANAIAFNDGLNACARIVLVQIVDYVFCD